MKKLKKGVVVALEFGAALILGYLAGRMVRR